MFNFFWYKKIDPENIKNYKEAIKVIKFFIATLEWEKTKKAIFEIQEKEKKSFDNLIEEIDNSWDNKRIIKEKEKITKEYQKKQKELDKLLQIIKQKEYKYNKKIEEKKFKLRFNKII